MTSQGRQIMNPKSNLVTWYHTSKFICRSDTKMYWLTLSHWFVSSSCVNHTSKHNRLKCTVCARRPTHRHTTASPVGRPAAAAVMTDGRCTTGNALTEHTQSPGSSSGLPWSSHCGSENLTHQRVWQVMKKNPRLLLLMMMMMQRSLPVYTVGGSGRHGDADVYQLLTESVQCVCVCKHGDHVSWAWGETHRHWQKFSTTRAECMLSVCESVIRPGPAGSIWYLILYTHTRARDL